MLICIAKERERMKRLMGEREEGWYEMESNENVVMMVDRACRDEAGKGSGKNVEEMICNM